MTLRHVRIASLAVVLCALAGACGNDDGGGAAAPSPATSTTAAATSRPVITHELGGRSLTCEEALDVNPELGCPDGVVRAWQAWGANLAAFVDSGTLGPLNDGSYEVGDVAYVGLMACLVAADGGDEQDFIDFVGDPRNETQLEDLSGTELLPTWFTALEELCPDTGFRSSDDTIP